MKTLSFECHTNPEDKIVFEQHPISLWIAAYDHDSKKAISIELNGEDTEKLRKFLQPAEPKKPPVKEAKKDQ